jgi:hypothetical protein
MSCGAAPAARVTLAPVDPLRQAPPPIRQAAALVLDPLASHVDFR